MKAPPELNSTYWFPCKDEFNTTSRIINAAVNQIGSVTELANLHIQLTASKEWEITAKLFRNSCRSLDVPIVNVFFDRVSR